MSKLTDSSSYYEDFAVGQKIRHARGTTIDEVENQLLTKLVMNTAQAHWNEDAMRGGGNSPFGAGRVVFGFITAAMVIGLATQDTGENAIKELGLDKIKFRSPVHHGDTVYAYTQVLDKTDADGDSVKEGGVVTFKHWGVNQDGVIVFEGERRVNLKSREAA